MYKIKWIKAEWFGKRIDNSNNISYKYKVISKKQLEKIRITLLYYCEDNLNDLIEINWRMWHYITDYKFNLDTQVPVTYCFLLEREVELIYYRFKILGNVLYGSKRKL